MAFSGVDTSRRRTGSRPGRRHGRFTSEASLGSSIPRRIARARGSTSFSSVAGGSAGALALRGFRVSDDGGVPCHPGQAGRRPRLPRHGRPRASPRSCCQRSPQGLVGQQMQPPARTGRHRRWSAAARSRPGGGCRPPPACQKSSSALAEPGSHSSSTSRTAGLPGAATAA